MKPIKVLELSEVDRLKLEKGYHNGPTHSFRIRCKSILLKSEGKSAPQIAEMLEVTVPTVYTWIKRYEENGISKAWRHVLVRGESLLWIVLMKKQSARQLRKTVRMYPKHVKHGRMRLVKKQENLNGRRAFSNSFSTGDTDSFLISKSSFIHFMLILCAKLHICI